MSCYYFVSEVSEEPEEPFYDPHNYNKPQPCNLILPSIHASRKDNVLLAYGDAQEAVKALQDSCKGSNTWPSFGYNNKGTVTETPPAQDEEPSEFVSQVEEGYCSEVIIESTETENHAQPPPSAKYRPPYWAPDVTKNDVLEAARALFYERKRQQAVYGAFPSWNNLSGAPRIPTDYELFTAWASLPRSEKMVYISEVNNFNFPNHAPRDSLETQRAVSMLYASCSDSMNWPSNQFSRRPISQPPHSFHRRQAPPPAFPVPRHSYQQYHHLMVHNPLPFKLD